MTQQLPNKRLVARSFARAASHYDEVAVLQRQTADELLDRLSLVTLQPDTVVDLGAGTGRNLALLAKHYPKAKLVAVDIAPAMLTTARQNHQQNLGMKRWLPNTHQPRYIVGDVEQLPLADNSVDLIYANLVLQWCDPDSSFAEISRVLRPDGLLMFSSFGPNTLTELRQAWAKVDAYDHVNIFFDMHDIGEAMLAAQLADPVLDTDHYTLTYDNALALMQDLKTLGANNVNHNRRRSLTASSALKKVELAYNAFRENGSLPASYEVVYGHAWGADTKQQQRASDGSITIPVSQIQGSNSG